MTHDSAGKKYRKMEKCRIKVTISLQFNIFSFTNLGNLKKKAYICTLLDKESTIIHESI